MHMATVRTEFEHAYLGHIHMHAYVRAIASTRDGNGEELVFIATNEST